MKTNNVDNKGVVLGELEKRIMDTLVELLGDQNGKTYTYSVIEVEENAEE